MTAATADLVSLFAQAGIQLAIAESCGPGTVASALRESGAAAAITSARAFGSPEELAVALRVSDAKIEAFGAVSAMVAAEAAAELIDTYEGGWGLAALCGGNRDAHAGVSRSAGSAPGCFIALGTPSATQVEPCEPERAVEVALALLAAAAETRLATPRPY